MTVATWLLDTNGAALTFRRGTTPIHTFAVTDKATGNPKDLTGATVVSFAIGAHSGATARDLTLTLGSGVTHNGTGGVVSVSLTAVQTEALPLGRRWAELWITDAAGQRDVPARGWCRVDDTLITV